MRRQTWVVALLSAAVSIGALVPTCAAGSSTTEPIDALMGVNKHIVFVSYFGRSHMMPYLEILQPLADRGHKVTIVTDYQALNWLQPNYPSYNIRLVPNELCDAVQERLPEFMKNLVGGGQQNNFVNVLKHITLPSYKELALFFKDLFTAEKPDLVLCDFMSDACSDMADTLGIKMGVTLSGIPPGVSETPYINSWTSSVLAATMADMSLWDRFYNKVVAPVRTLAAMRDSLVKLQRIKDELGVVVTGGPGPQRFNKALKVINTFIGFEAARPVDPTVQLVGPIRSLVNSTMPQNIQDWIHQLPRSSSNYVDSQPKRIIYVAFGTHLDLPDYVLSSLMTAMVSTIDQGLADGVIWAVSKIKRDRFPAGLDSRVLLLPFAPQKAVLASPDVCLFVSHGGAESAHEAMYEGKPLLIVPFFGDQPMNAVKMTEAGFAEFIPYADVTAPRVQALLAKLINPNTDPLSPDSANTHAVAAKRQQALVRTLIKHNKETAADMLLFFAHHGWSHLISADKNMPWWKATDADIIAVCALACVAVLAGVVVAMKALVSLLSKNMFSSKQNAAAKYSTSAKPLQNADEAEPRPATDADADIVIKNQVSSGLNGTSVVGVLRSRLCKKDSAMLNHGSTDKADTVVRPAAAGAPVLDIKAKAL